MNAIDIETSSKRAVGIDGTVTGTSSHPGPDVIAARAAGPARS